MVSACGAASTLLAFNAANAALGRTGGFFELEQVAAVEPGVALDRLGGHEFVFDVQGHFVGQHGLGQTGLGGAEQFIKDIFLDSDIDSRFQNQRYSDVPLEDHVWGPWSGPVGHRCNAHRASASAFR